MYLIDLFSFTIFKMFNNAICKRNREINFFVFAYIRNIISTIDLSYSLKQSRVRSLVYYFLVLQRKIVG